MVTSPASLGTRRFAHVLRTERKKRGWNRERAAEWLGISPAHVGKIESLRLESVSLKLAERLAQRLDLDARYFFEDGPDDLDYSEYLGPQQRSLTERIARIERALGTK